MGFRQDFYIPEIQKLALHLLHLRILETLHCGNTHREAFKIRSDFRDVLYRRDYAERVVATFSHQVQYE